MSIFDPIKKIVVGHEVGNVKEEVVSGKLGAIAKAVWTFLDGKKTVIMAVLLAVEAYMRAHGGVGILGYADVVTHAIGWDSVTPAVNPSDLVAWAGMTIALGHKLVKAYQASQLSTTPTK
jgi:hypothetical protein